VNNQPISNIINHIVLVLDASSSMDRFANELVKVADKQIAYLAQRSKELDQETRITVYTFATKDYYGTPDIRCLIYDKDVLRVPSITGLYRPNGMTPLIDATLLALNDLALTPEKYGQHSFLIYVLTDGQENVSDNTPDDLTHKITNLPDHWTIATFVPDQTGVYEAKHFGFPKENIAVWDATSIAGINEAGERIRKTTETFMQNRSKGIRGSRNLFTMDTPSVAAVASTLNGLHYGQFRLLDVDQDCRIDEFVEHKLRRPYKLGEAYYQLMKSETIQPQKEIAILANSTVYIGHEARQLLGLPDYHVKVKPSAFPGYEIFVQSTSVNRKLIGGTKLLILS
jgi:hypothetical protein